MSRISKLLRVLRLDSIRSQMVLFGVVATLIPSFTTSWISYEQNKRSLTEKITGELQSISAQTAREMDLWVKERLYELRVFASSYEVSENVDRMSRSGADRAAARLNDYLHSVRDRFTDYKELLVLSPQGAVVATTARATTPVHLPANWTTVIKRDNAVIGDAYWDAGLGTGVVVFAVPIYQTGRRFLGALTAKVDLAAVHHLLRRFASGAAARVYLISTDGGGLVGSETQPAELMQRRLDTAVVAHLLAREGSPIEFSGFDHEGVVATAKRVPQLEWAVLVQVPSAEAFRQITQLRNVSAAIVTALLVGVGLLAYFFGLLITRPLDRLRQGAARVAGADLSVDLPVRGSGELRYVTEVFNDMVARLREGRRELERLSITDDLTGLYNRRYLMDALANEARRSRRLKHPFTLLMLDVDHFKEYNDAHGHLAGDAALARIATILREVTRDVDCAARYGGEEFAVVLPETEAAGATETAQRIQTRLARDDVVGGKLTLSVGVAQFPLDGDGPEELLAGADAALYQAKREGRNRVLRAVH